MTERLFHFYEGTIIHFQHIFLVLLRLRSSCIFLSLIAGANSVGIAAFEGVKIKELEKQKSASGVSWAAQTGLQVGDSVLIVGNDLTLKHPEKLPQLLCHSAT